MPFDQESTNSMLNVEDNNKVDHSTVLFLVRILKLSCETMFEKKNNSYGLIALKRLFQ